MNISLILPLPDECDTWLPNLMAEEMRFGLGWSNTSITIGMPSLLLLKFTDINSMSLKSIKTKVISYIKKFGLLTQKYECVI